MRFRSCLIAVLVCVTFSLPAAAAGDNVWHSDEFDYTTQVFPTPTFNSMSGKVPETVRVIALLPVDLGMVAPLVPNSASAASRIEAQATQRLEAAGYKVVPADEMRKILSETDASIGPFYDQRTGRPYPDRLRKRMETIWKTHQERHAADAFLFMGVVPRKAEVNRFTAKWDGVDENVSGRGALADFIKGAPQQFAAIPGLSLGVWLVRADKVLIYGGTGGLHLAAYIRQTGSHPDYLEIGRSEAILADTRIGRALDIALQPALPKKVDKSKKSKDSRARSAAVSFPQAPVSGGPAEGAPAFLTAEQFRARHKKIALTPVQLPESPNRDDLQRHFESIIRKQLETAGFEVVSSDVFMKYFEQELAANDRFFDPRTGKVDPDSFTALRTRALERECQEQKCDALVVASVLGRPALFTGAEAHWLGTSQIVTGDSTALVAKLNSRGNYVGTVPASVVRVEVGDLSNTVLFEGYGGLELLARLEDTGFKEIPQARHFQDLARNEAAVTRALADLLTVRPPTK